MRWSCVHRFGSCRGEEGKLLLLCSLRCHPPSDAVMLCLSPQRVLELVLPRPSLGRKLRMGHRVGRLEAPTCPSLHSAVLFPGDLVPGRKMQMSFRSRICFPWWFAMSVLLEREFSRLKSRLSQQRVPANSNCRRRLAEENKQYIAEDTTLAPPLFQTSSVKYNDARTTR